MRPTTLMPASLIGLGLSGMAVAGPVKIVSQSVAVNDADRLATFTLKFNHAPDFTPGPNGQHDAFQYEIDTKTDQFTNDISFDDITSVIRGTEIDTSKALPIRARDGDGGANSGGWGPVRDSVPFSVNGNYVKFTASFDDLGEDDGVFRYRVFASEDGETTSSLLASNPSAPNGVVVPVPPSAWSGLSMLGAMGVARMRSRWGRTRARVL
jgi:hypothetical protein